MPNYTDPRFLAGALSLVIGGARVLGRKAPPPGLPGGPGFAAPGTIGRQAAERLAGATATGRPGDLSGAEAITRLASDPSFQAQRVRSALSYMDIINRSLSANAPLSGDAAAVAGGSGSDLAANMAPLAVIDRINALDETFGPSVEGWRQTFAQQTQPAQAVLELRPVVAGSGEWQEVGGQGRRFTATELADLERSGRVQWVAPGIINPGPYNAPAARVTVTRGVQVVGYYATRLAVIRATTEALMFGRDALRSFGVAILDDTTGNIKPDWVSYLASFQVVGDDIQAMARQVAAGMVPRPGAFETLLRGLSQGLAFVMGGLQLLDGLSGFAANVTAGVPLDPAKVGEQAAALTQEALTLYSSGARLVGGPASAASPPLAAPLAPEEGRLLNWMAGHPQPMPTVRVVAKRSGGALSSGARRASVLLGLSGGGIAPRNYFEALGGRSGWEDLEAAVKAAPGVLNPETRAIADAEPGTLAVKCLLLARRYPFAVMGGFSTIYTPAGLVSALPGAPR